MFKKWGKRQQREESWKESNAKNRKDWKGRVEGGGNGGGDGGGGSCLGNV